MLGKEWERGVDGQNLKNKIDAFRRKLNTDMIIDDWIQRVQAKEDKDFDKVPYRCTVLVGYCRL